MNTARTWSAHTLGFEAHLFEIEAERIPGQQGLALAGLPDRAAMEVRNRTAGALADLGIRKPDTIVRCTQKNPGSPDLHRLRENCMTGADLAVTLAVLGAYGRVDPDRLAGTVVVAQVDVDRKSRRWTRCGLVRGAMVIAEATRKKGLSLLVAAGNGLEARTECPRTAEARTVEDAIEIITKGIETPSSEKSGSIRDRDLTEPRWNINDADLRILEIAAAGGHDLHVIGTDATPATTVYARILHELLPDLSDEESRETTKIHSLAGILDPGEPRIVRPPLRAPHFTASEGAIHGTVHHPGEVSLAHNGVLLIDQPTEFQRHVVDRAGTAHEECQARWGVSYHDRPVRYPARFHLVVTSQPHEAGRPDIKTDRLVGPRAVRMTSTVTSRTERRSLAASAERVAAAQRRLKEDRPTETTEVRHIASAKAESLAVAATIAALDGDRKVTTDHLVTALALINGTGRRGQHRRTGHADTNRNDSCRVADPDPGGSPDEPTR